MKRTFIYTDDKSNKFWTIEVSPTEFTVSYGKVGTAGQTSSKTFDNEAACKKEVDKLIAEKTKKGYVETVTEGSASSSAATSQAEQAKQVLDELNKWLEANGIEDLVEISYPVSKKEIEKAEKKLKVKFPPSYTDFVTRYGTFYFDGELLGRGSGNDTNLLTPEVIVEQTIEYREEFEEFGDYPDDHDYDNDDEYDPDIEANRTMKDGLLFCSSPDNERYYLYVISSADATGEMKARHFDYQDLGMNDGWLEGDMTFLSVVTELAELIKDYQIRENNALAEPQIATKAETNSNNGSTLQTLTDKNYKKIVTLTDPEEAEETYKISEDVNFPFLDFTEEIETFIHRGNLHLASVDGGEFNLIIDGDLTVDGDLEWSTDLDGSFLLVTGNVKAKNLLLGGCANVAIRGNVEVENGILGAYGDDGGELNISGTTRAKLIVNMLYFSMWFGKQPEALIINDYQTNCTIDFNEEEALQALLPKFIDDDGEHMDFSAIRKAMQAGDPILRKGAMPASEALVKYLNELAQNADEVTSLDLSQKRMKRLPEQLFRFTKLKVLDLSDNQLEVLSPRIGELTELEELDLQHNSLETLPAEIGKLKKLRSLDLRYLYKLTSLPDEIGDLSGLKELSLNETSYDLPQTMAKLDSLETLYIDTIKGKASVIFDLKNLKKLELSNTPLAAIDDRFLKLQMLEELELDRLGNIEKVCDLSKLTHLRKLTLDGGTSPYAKLELLQVPEIWNIPSLEELDLSRWGEEKDYDSKKGKHVVQRECLKSLPDNAFANMPKLRKLTISFTELETLPESFFALKHLEEVEMEYATLNKVTLDRVFETFPTGVKFDLRRCKTSNMETDTEVGKIVKKGAEHMSKGNQKEALKTFEEAVKLCDSGKPFSDYNRLYAQYGLVYCLGRLIANIKGSERETALQQLIAYNRKALELAPPVGLIWVFTDEGQFQKEVNREAGNSLGWFLMETGELEEALRAIQRGVDCIEGGSHYYIYDTQVRILLKLGRTDEAYRIVDFVLGKDPDFGDFADLKNDKDFLAWKAKGGK